MASPRTHPASPARPPEPFFDVDGDSFIPTHFARGPWGEIVGGHTVGGLLARAAEHIGGQPDFQPARLTVDLLRPTMMEPIRIRTDIQRAGRRIRLVTAALVQRDVVVARASALFLRRAQRPESQIWSPPLAMPPLPPEPEILPAGMPMFIHSFSGTDTVGALGVGTDVWLDPQQKFAWMRQLRPLVAGETTSPFTLAAMAAEVTSALSHWGSDGLRYINADYTVSLTRLPDGPYLGLAVLSHYSDDGVATGVTAIFDQKGPIGNGMAVALVNPADKFVPR